MKVMRKRLEIGEMENREGGVLWFVRGTFAFTCGRVFFFFSAMIDAEKLSGQFSLGFKAAESRSCEKNNRVAKN